MNSTMDSDWAWLPKNLLDMILDNLDSLSDYVHFGAVCKPWHLVAMENKIQFIENKGCKQLPLLLVPTKDNSEERRSLYNIAANKTYDFQLRVPYNKRLSGSSYGWLFTVEENMGVTLINPFSGSTIGLPPIMDISKFEYHESDEDDNELDFEIELYKCDDPIEVEYQVCDDPIEVEYQVLKATLSADPALSPDDYIVTAIYGDTRQLAFIKSGDKAWTYLDDESFDVFLDVIYCKGQIVAVDYWGRVIMVDLNRRVGESKVVPLVKVIAARTKVHFDRTYLVESSSGDLLIVQRFLKEIGDDLQHETAGFKVFKLLLVQPNEKGKAKAKRIEVKSLGGDAMFLGDNHTTCVSASKFSGCHPNSIYYTDDYGDIARCPPYGRRDIGIFDVENGSFDKPYLLDPSHKDMPPSIWIIPTVLGN